MAANVELLGHLGGGVTTTCQCWAITRADGVTLGFTDHDEVLNFDGIQFLPDSGVAATALQQTTGLSVNNTEALGVLKSDAISEAGIAAGKYDGAGVKAWLVNWQDVVAKMVLFAGTIGEISRGETGFTAELRGLTEGLNVRRGAVFQKSCPAALGDARCGVDLETAGYSASLQVGEIDGGTVLRFAPFGGYAESWFAHGRMVVEGGQAQGQQAAIKRDADKGGWREIELWEPLRGLLAGDTVRLETGCDKQPETCRLKFSNFANFRGYPHLPSHDWVAAVPRSGGLNDGGSMNK